MSTSKSNEQLVFNHRTLRLIIGALAFAFPAMVAAFAGRITTSISASYHEAATRNFFVGFMFVIGALLVSYKGHRRIIPNGAGSKLWVSLRRYEEDWISAIGGIAAIATALSPTACDGCSVDLKARIHLTGAFILFAAVVYFCLVAFLRSLNEKLLGYAELGANPELRKRIDEIQAARGQTGANPVRRFVRFLTCESMIFRSIAAEASRQYDAAHLPQTGNVPFAVTKFFDLGSAYGKKLARGWAYVICGALIAVTLAGFVLIQFGLPDVLAGSKATFVVETICLVLFGFSWMTASQLRYYRKIKLFLKLRSAKTALAPQLGNI
jgi:hypothetical protein